MENLQISSHLKEYTVQFIEESKVFLEQVKGLGSAVCVIDKNVAAMHGDIFQEISKMMPVLQLEATEAEKTWRGTEKVLTFLQENQATKQTTLLALGGGIVQDISSLAAALYYRGIPFVFTPTTLLAASDSCIGSKSGLNFKSYKNQIGVFYAPDKILMWPKFLETLQPEDVRSGFGEMLKLFLIGGEEDYQFLKDYIALEGFSLQKILPLIIKSLQVKKTYIEQDEFDVGIRRILNYGHTFGHALESLTNYGISHGTAVTWGMDLVNYIALRQGLLDQKCFDDVHAVIRKYFSFEISQPLTAEGLLLNAKRDKKVSQGKLNLVLLQSPGELIIKPFLFDDRLRGMTQDFLAVWLGQ